MFSEQRLYIVVSVDNRRNRSEEEARISKNAPTSNWEKLEVQDQIEAAKHLRLYPYVDGRQELEFKVGVYGGIYVFLTLLTKRSRRSSKWKSQWLQVTNWRILMIPIYTERYMAKLHKKIQKVMTTIPPTINQCLENLEGKVFVSSWNRQMTMYITKTTAEDDYGVSQCHKQFRSILLSDRSWY